MAGILGRYEVALGEHLRVVIGDPRTFTDEELGRSTALHNTIRAEQLPGEVPVPVAVDIAAVRAERGDVGVWAVEVRTLDGELVGDSFLRKDWVHDDNPDSAPLRLRVAATHRRRGVGAAIVAHVVGIRRAMGVMRLQAHVTSRMPEGLIVVEQMGGQAKSWGHTNHLMLADVNRLQLDGWVADAGHRSADYELLRIDGPIPDELAEAYVDLVLVMNTAPRDDIETNDFTFSLEELHQREAQLVAGDVQLWTLLARHRETRELVGYHDVAWVPFDPTLAFVGDTAVRPEHRGHALGRWLKAAMTIRLLEERPEVLEVRTDNADSNDAMLAINAAMGYVEWMAETTYELSMAGVEAWLAERGVAVPDLTAIVDAQRPATRT